MTRVRVAKGAAVVHDDDVVYVARLPTGPIVVLEGVAAVVWNEACDRERDTLASRVSAAFGSPSADIAEQVDEFVATLVAEGLLEVSVDD